MSQQFGKNVVIVVALIAAGFFAAWLRFRSYLGSEGRYSDGVRAYDLDAADEIRYAVWDRPLPIVTEGATLAGTTRAALSPDGRWLVFAATDGGFAHDLHLAEVVDGQVLAARALALLSSPAEDCAPAFGADALYFASDRTGSLGGFDLYRAPYADGIFGEPVRLEGGINTAADETDPGPVAGSIGLAFASNRAAGRFDLYLAAGDGAGSYAVEPLTRVNSAHDEREPSFTADGRHLFFASDRPGGRGGFDLYRSALGAAGWVPPVPLYGINGPEAERSPLASPDGFELWFVSARADGGPTLAAELTRARSLELFRVPGRPVGWRELLLLAALLALALLAWLAKRWEELEVLYKCLLVSLVVHALLLWWLREVYPEPSALELAGGGERLRVRVATSAAPVSEGDIERAGELQRVARVTEEAARALEHASASAGTLSSAQPRSARLELAPAELAPGLPQRATPATDPRPMPEVTQALTGPREEFARRMVASRELELVASGLAAPRAAPRGAAGTVGRATTGQGSLAPVAPAAPTLARAALETSELAAPAGDAGAFPVLAGPGAGERELEVALEHGSEPLTRRAGTSPELVVEAVTGESRAPAPARSPAREADPSAQAGLPPVALALAAPATVLLPAAAPVGPAPAPRSDREELARRPDSFAGIAAVRSASEELAPRAVADAEELAIEPAAPASVRAPAQLGQPAAPGPRTEREAREGLSAPLPSARALALERAADVAPSARAPVQGAVGPAGRVVPLATHGPASLAEREAPPTGVAAGATSAEESSEWTVAALNFERGVRPLAELERRGPLERAGSSTIPPAASTSLAALELAREHAHEPPLAAATKLAPPERVRTPAAALAPLRGEAALSAFSDSVLDLELVAVAFDRARESAREPAWRAPTALGAPDQAAPAPRALANPGRVALPAQAPRGTRWDHTPYKSREGASKVAALELYGGSQETEAAVAAGLAYLARIQHADGYWGSSADRHTKYRHVAIGKTGLVLLAFLGAGHTPGARSEHAATVERAVEFLLTVQDRASGHFGDSCSYGHGIATYALAECFALTTDARLRAPLERAVEHILREQARGSDPALGGGWGYYYPDGEIFDRWPRASITAWQVMALESARLGGLEVPDAAFAAARTFLRNAWDAERGAFRYSHDPARLSSSYDILPGSTPASLFALSLLGDDIQGAAYAPARAFVAARAPRAFARAREQEFVRDAKGNLYFWYYGTLAMFRAGGDAWQRWNAAMLATLLPAQEADGSWRPISVYATDYAGDDERDRAYTTAMCVLSLEIYYRYFTPLLKVE